MKKTIFSLLCVFFSLLLNFKKSFSQNTSIIRTKAPKPPRKIIIKYGLASFYAKKFIGRKTSNGAKYNAEILTAACNVLPLGTWVKVTNLKNEKSVIVIINDHLHYKNKRLIDLSKCAARKLAFISRGITRVKVEVLGELTTRNLYETVPLPVSKN